MNKTTPPNVIKKYILGTIMSIFALCVFHNGFASNSEDVSNIDNKTFSTKSNYWLSFSNQPFVPGISIVVNGVPLAGLESGPGCNLVLYEIIVTNEGTDILENVVVSDDLLDGTIVGPISGDDNNDNILDVNEIWTYSAQHITTIEEKVTQEVETLTTVTANVQGQLNEVVQDNASTIVGMPSCPSNSDIAVVKTGVAIDGVEGGPGCDLVLYEFTVTNIGGDVLENVVLRDPLISDVLPVFGPDSGDINNNNLLEPNETWTYSAQHITTTQEKIDQQVVNQANVSANIQGDPNTVVVDLSDDNSVLENDPTITALISCPSIIALIKEGTVIDVDGDGCLESILYTFTVTNNGDVDLIGVILEDELLGGEVPGPVDGTDINNDGILSPGETWTYEAIYAITPEDIVNQSVINQAKVSALTIDNVLVEDDSDDDSFLENEPTRTPVPDDACSDGGNIGLIKEGVVVDVDGDGCLESILYTFTVTNTGGIDLDAISLNDLNLFGGQDIPGPVEGTDDNNDGVLSVDETWVFEALYAITQEDIDNQSVINQAIVSAEPVGFDNLVFDNSDNDSLFEDEPTRTPVPDDACTDGGANIGLIKVGAVIDANGDGCLDSILYSFTVTNTGNVDLDGLVLKDENLFGDEAILGPIEGSDENNDGVLSVDETWNYEALYAITQEDIDNAAVLNQATIQANLVGMAGQVLDLSDEDSLFENEWTRTPVPDDACPPDNNGSGPGIGLIKTGTLMDNNGDLCEDSIRYIFSVTNTGDFDLDNVIIEDELVENNIQGPLANTDINDDGILSIGESWSFETIYIIQQADIEEGFVQNQATVVANLSGFNVQIMDLSDHTNLVDDNPTITLVPAESCTNGGSPADFEIFNGITPNGDDMNDFFRILGIENYPDNHLKIFNRWGVLVYEKENYGQDNDLFYGISQGRATLQKEKELPSGTYFYILTIEGENPGKPSYSGYLYINRD